MYIYIYIYIYIYFFFFFKISFIVIEKMCHYNSKDGVQGRAGHTLKKSKNTFNK